MRPPKYRLMFAPRGFTVWLTGLPCSGKSTLSSELERELLARGRRVEVLDGDVVRTHLSRGLGFSREDRDINVRRIGFVAQLLSRNGVAVLVAAVSPYRAARRHVRQEIADFVEVYVQCPLAECERRDVKGMYAKARVGAIQGFTGVDDPYEAPEHAEVVVRTAEQTTRECVQAVLAKLEELGHLRGSAALPSGARAER